MICESGEIKMTDAEIMNIWRVLNDRSVEERVLSLGRACYREGYGDCVHESVDKPNPYQVVADLIPQVERALYVLRIQPETPEPETNDLTRALFKLKTLIEE
jgi:hypothetical protein